MIRALTVSVEASSGPGARHEHARGGIRRDMQRERRVGARIVEQTVGDHVACAVMPFLARLEHEYDRPRQRVTVRTQCLGRADQHRGMRIMPARVHRAGDGRGEIESRFLLHWQRIHIAAQQYRPPVIPALATQDRDQPGRRWSFAIFERQSRQRRLDLRGGVRTVEPDFRLAMDRAPQCDRIVQPSLTRRAPVGRNRSYRAS